MSLHLDSCLRLCKLLVDVVDLQGSTHAEVSCVVMYHFVMYSTVGYSPLFNLQVDFINWVICRDMDGPRDCHTE